MNLNEGLKKQNILKNIIFKRILPNWELYLLIFLPLVYLIVFKYIPMYGVQIAFKNYRAVDGILGSPWVGMKHFNTFFSNFMFKRLIRNTLTISIYSLIAGFPMPIILALLLNYMPLRRFKKTVQSVSYAPNFISTVIICGMVILFLSERNGLLNNVIAAFGGERVNFMASPQFFSSIYVWSGVWQSMGFGSIIYIAALSGVDPQLHEAGIVDGASILRRIWHIDLPTILPTIVILLVLNAGQLMNVGFEKVLLLQNQLNLNTSEVISTHVYKVGILNSLGDFSYPAAIDFFTAVINLFLLTIVNYAAKRMSGSSLW